MSSLSTSRGVRCTTGLRRPGSYPTGWPDCEMRHRGCSIIAAMHTRHLSGLALLMAATAACGGPEPAKPAAATAPAAAPATPAVRLFVTNEASGNLTVIDAATQA